MTYEDYQSRLVDPVITQLFGGLPALLIVGPRAAGKTTTAARHVRTVVRLDRPAEAAAFAADPDAALARLDEPALLDEWHAVPAVLGAVKRAVDDRSAPGRFILTGSVRGDLDADTWPGTGRVVRVSMFGLNMREIVGFEHTANPVDVLAAGDPMGLVAASEVPTLPDYVDLGLRGGFPDAVLRLDGARRTAWLQSYCEQLVTRDAAEAAGRDPVRMARFLEVLAINSAGVVSEATLLAAAGLNRKTAAVYEQLLANLYVVDVVPAWFTNRLSRLVKTPKRYLVDPSLMGAALRLDADAVLRDGDLLGRLIDTFVAAQLRPEIAVSEKRPRVFHLRDKDGRHEVDLIAELGGDRVIAIEVKASATPTRSDAAHLEWLRDRLGDRFVSGVVLHTGPSTFSLGDRIAAAPIAALWSTPRV